ncbi:hypothetical protein BASA62_001897 [Batrachochytrium salamandrivorans]|nr:hypothetical protein BASA62_001897 [Batrachochytrium salamandrivorans]
MSARHLLQIQWTRAWKKEYYLFHYGCCHLGSANHVWSVTRGAVILANHFQRTPSGSHHYLTSKSTGIEPSIIDPSKITPDKGPSPDCLDPLFINSEHGLTDDGTDTLFTHKGKLHTTPHIDIPSQDLLGQFQSLLNDIPLERMPSLPLSQAIIDQIWTTLAAICDNPSLASTLTANHITKLQNLAIHDMGNFSSRFQSIWHLITLLRVAVRPDLLPPVHLEFLSRYTLRLPYSILDGILADLRESGAQRHVLGDIFQVTLTLLVSKGRILDIHRWVAASEDFDAFLEDSINSAHPKNVESVERLSRHSDGSRESILSLALDGISCQVRSPVNSSGTPTDAIGIAEPLVSLTRADIWQALKNKGETARLRQMFDAADINTITIAEYNSVLSALLSADDIDGFQEVWCRISHKEHPVKPNLVSFNLLIRCQLKSTGFEAGLACFQLIHEAGLSPSVSEYNPMIDFLFKSDDATKAMVLFDRIRQSAILPNSDTYLIMISNCASKQMVLHAFKYYYALQESKVVYTLPLWSALVNAFVKVGDMGTAVRCFQDLLADTNVDPDRYVFAHLIEGYISQKEYMKAFEYIGKACDWGLESESVIMALLNRLRVLSGRDSEDILRDYYRMLPQLKEDYQLLALPPLHLEKFFFLLVRHFARLQQMNICISIVDQMKQLGLDIRNVQGSIISGFSLAGDISAASNHLQLARQDPLTPIPTSVYNDLLVGSLHVGKVSFADMVLSEMVQMGLDIRPIVLNSYLKHDVKSTKDIRPTLTRMEALGVKYNSRTVWLVMYYHGVVHRQFDEAWNTWCQYADYFGLYDASSTNSPAMRGADSTNQLPLDFPDQTQPEPRLIRLIVRICIRFYHTEKAEEVIRLVQASLTQQEYQEVYEAYHNNLLNSPQSNPDYSV